MWTKPALFIWCNLRKRPHFRGEIWTGGKLSNARISVLVGSNCDTTENYLSLVLENLEIQDADKIWIKHHDIWDETHFWKIYSWAEQTIHQWKTPNSFISWQLCSSFTADIWIESRKRYFFPLKCTCFFRPMAQIIIESTLLMDAFPPRDACKLTTEKLDKEA